MTLLEKYPKGFKSTVEMNNVINGKSFKIVGKKSNHQLPIGTDIVASYTSGSLSSPRNMLVYDTSGYGYYLQDLAVVPLTIEEITKANLEIDKQLKELTDEKASNLDKIKFMKENDLEEYDDKVFKTFSILKTLDKKSSNIEKAKAIAKIIDNN